MNLEQAPTNHPKTEQTSQEHVHFHTKTERAFEIAGKGNYEEILKDLENEGLLEAEILRTKETYGEDLEHAPWMTEKDWKMLTIMDSYDSHTARHCVETFRIAHDRVDRFMAGDKKFSELIIHEGISLDDFFRACLFHDIGKCLIPRSILNNTLSDNDFNTQLCKDVFRGGHSELLNEIEKTTGHTFEIHEGRDSEKQLHEYLTENHVHTMRYVPAREVLKENDINLIKERFPHINFDEATLADLIKPHEEGSEQILYSQGFTVAAEIAGKHHNYRKLEVRFPVTTEIAGVTVALEELLALSDMKQALSAKRSYKKALGTPLVLRNLIIEAERHEISSVITSLWVEQELELLSNEELLTYDEPTINAIQECRDFINSHKTTVAHFVSQFQIKLAA